MPQLKTQVAVFPTVNSYTTDSQKSHSTLRPKKQLQCIHISIAVTILLPV